MTFRDQLDRLEACPESLEWVQDKTIEEAWETCKNTEWMLWFLTRTDWDLIDPVCDMVERVLYLVPEDIKLVCSNAISVARRRGNIYELANVWSAAKATAVNAAPAASAAAYAAYYTARIHAAYDAAAAAATCYAATSYASNTIYYARGYDDYKEEKEKQCDILRKYFTIDQIKEALNKLVA